MPADDQILPVRRQLRTIAWSKVRPRGLISRRGRRSPGPSRPVDRPCQHVSSHHHPRSAPRRAHRRPSGAGRCAAARISQTSSDHRLARAPSVPANGQVARETSRDRGSAQLPASSRFSLQASISPSGGPTTIRRIDTSSSGTIAPTNGIMMVWRCARRTDLEEIARHR